jgi:hypothetical protein
MAPVHSMDFGAATTVVGGDCATLDNDLFTNAR